MISYLINILFGADWTPSNGDKALFSLKKHHLVAKTIILQLSPCMNIVWILLVEKHWNNSRFKFEVNTESDILFVLLIRFYGLFFKIESQLLDYLLVQWPERYCWSVFIIAGVHLRRLRSLLEKIKNILLLCSTGLWCYQALWRKTSRHAPSLIPSAIRPAKTEFTLPAGRCKQYSMFYITASSVKATTSYNIHLTVVIIYYLTGETVRQPKRKWTNHQRARWLTTITPFRLYVKQSASSSICRSVFTLNYIFLW